MNKFKYIVLFILLLIIGAFSSYAEMKLDNSYELFLHTFEDTNSQFKFYNIKANADINYDITREELKSMCIDIVSDLGMEESDITIDDKWEEDDKQIYVQAKDNNFSVSIVGVKKSENESYLIVDILDNKVYKNIVDIYKILDNFLNNHYCESEIYVCVAGEYGKELQKNKYNDILDKILYNMSAEVIEKVQEENFLSVTAYSKVLKENYLEYFGNKVNLNIGIRYSEDDEKTLIYIATPIIKLDY